MSDLFETILAVMYPAGDSKKVIIYLSVFSYPTNAPLPHPSIIPQSDSQISHKGNIEATPGNYIAGDYKNTKSGHPAISQLVKG